ncbi:MFS transporter [Lonepinella koalarum]|uniref:Putative MFS family arabinose efflux permease n=2 Tax=Lonepinella koalarum TaxID=53417 RepID=A0A4R1L4C9_9PAST|nr:MFS transporter [Lonepinella koalarum]TCK71069.1 putative MFS family arabinose efflux permease [Lonepinella koalarum]TFJ90800.1 MFS transporter [Lonepinella koalarum]
MIQKMQSSRFLLKLTIMMIGGFAFLQVYSIQAILPVLMEHFSASKVQAGLTVGVTVMAVAIISPVMGMFSDAVGRKSLIVICMLLIVFPTALLSISENITQIKLWRFLQGLFVPGVTVVTIAYISEEFPDRLASMLSLYVSGTVLGGFSGRFLIGYLHSIVGWQTGYLIFAGLMLIGVIWAALVLPASKNFVVSGNFRSSLHILRQHIQNPHVLTACALGACVLFSLVSIFTFINLHLADDPYYLSSANLANIFTVYLIGMLITPLTAKLIHNVGIANSLLLAIMSSIIGALITLCSPLWLIIVGLIIMSSGVFISQATTISHISQHVNQGRSLASGLYYMCYYTGGSIGAWVCGISYTYFGWSGVVFTVVLLQIVALNIVFFGIKLAKRTTP